MRLLSEHNDAFSSFYPTYRDRDTISLDDRGWPLFSAQLKDHIERKKDIKFIIPPNDYVLCNGAPLFSDTLKVTLHVGRIRIGPRLY